MRRVLIVVAALGVAAACSGKKKQAQGDARVARVEVPATADGAARIDDVDVRCERLLPKELLDRYFPGGSLKPGNEASGWSRTCAIAPADAKPGQVGTVVQLSCGKTYVTDEAMAKQRELAGKQRFEPIAGVGRWAARRQGDLRLWDKDTPCFFMVHHFPAPEKIIAFALDLEAATTASSYDEPPP